MSLAELDQVVGAMRAATIDMSTEPSQLRKQVDEMLTAIPVADDLLVEASILAGMDVLISKNANAVEGRAILYLHGGGYIFGSPRAYLGLAGELGRAANAAAYIIAYRLAPEHPLPAAINDTVEAYRGLLSKELLPENIAIAGDSAGGGLAIAALTAIRDAGLPMPVAAVVLSPWVELACEGDSMFLNAAEDPALTRDGLLICAKRYLNGAPPTSPLGSPLHADLSKLPPILIQVGSAEILLDDASRLARNAGGSGVDTRLEIWPKMIHVWHAFGFMLAEGREAIQHAGQFLIDHFTIKRVD